MKFFYDPTACKYNCAKKKGTGYEITPADYCKAMHLHDYIYDIECYPNVFTITFHSIATGNIWRFEISHRKNDGVLLFEYLTQLKACRARMVGFNSLGYDYPMLHEVIKAGGHITCVDLYDKNAAIIATPWDDRRKHLIWDDQVFIPQIDLYKVHHFDNKNRATSLKMIEFNMRADSIQDLPFKPGFPLTDQQIDALIVYNDHDVFKTGDFYLETIPMLEFRAEMSEKYNRDFMNHNDTKLGKDYFIMELEKAGIECFHKVHGKKTPFQTPRAEIALRDVILPSINFNTPAFTAILKFLKSRIIHETKGVFSDLLEWQLGDVAQYSTLKKKRKKCSSLVQAQYTSNQIPLSWVESNKTGKIHYCCYNISESLNVTVGGLKYVFGLGGIHGSLASTTIVADNDYEIIDIDVTSYYPKLAIENGFFPEHLGLKFCEILLDLFNQRVAHPKHLFPDINAMLKLALNGTYGETNNSFSCFYDPNCTMSITLNGQLLLCMLSEYMQTIPGLQVVQMNTDGMTMKVPRGQADTVMMLCKIWEGQTGLHLERADYSRMFIRDVNNYIAEYTDGKLKRKGAYGYGDDLDWAQNHGQQIVAIAAEAALVKGISIHNTVHRHPVDFDFMDCTKVPRDSRLELVHTAKNEDGVEVITKQTPLQNITRYYVARNGGSMVKIMPPLPKVITLDANAPDRRFAVVKGSLVQPCNEMSRFVGWINYQYYIDEAEKLVSPLVA